MIEVNINDMMEAGAHFGHQTKRWNPKMRQYIYGQRSGVHIIDLQKTKKLANEALDFVTNTVANGQDILFVGTKLQAREVVKEQAKRCRQHYVNQRWMGGTLTNFKTIKKSIDHLIDIETRRENNDFAGYKKKELLEIDRKIIKLEASLGGIKKLNGSPAIVFIIDPKQEHIAVLEARKLGIPVMAITDSNCNPELIDFVIPGNDDAILSIQYFTQRVADACLKGLEKREQFIRQKDTQTASEPAKTTHKKRVSKGAEISDGKDGKPKTAYVGRSASNQFEGDGTEGFSAKAETAKEAVPSIKTEEDGSEDSDHKEAV